MDNVIESEKAERDDVCGCEGGPTLSVLKDVQKAYEERIEVVHRVGGPKKLQKQVQVLESWVSDLVAQNTLLAQTVEELETEVTSRLLIESRKHAEIECELRLEVVTLRKQLSRKDSDLRGLLEVLRRLRQFDYCAIDGIHFNEVTQSDIFGPIVWNKTICDKLNEMKMINDSLKIENVSKEREIRRLNKDMQQYEQTIISLRNDLSKNKYYKQDVIKKDAEVSTDISCCGQQECGDIEPVKEIGVKQEDSEDIKRRAKSLLALRQENVSLRHELHAMQGVLTALYEQCNVAELRTKFKDEVILEMRRQLRQAKVKLKEVTESRLSLQKEQDNEFKPSSYHSSNTTCVQQQPRRKRRVRPNMDLNINWESRDMYESGDEPISSTPNTSHINIIPLQRVDSDVLIIERSPSPPLLISDPSISDNEESKTSIYCDCGRTSPSPENKDKHSTGTRKQHIFFREPTSNGKHGGSIAKDSIGAVSIESAASEGTRIQLLENKLHATIEILKNKEETIRVQAESLALAEARITALSSKTQALPKIHQTQQTNVFNNRSSADGNHFEMTDVSTSCVQDVDHGIVRTLRDNLSIIEELYRECFYETAKQEELINILRRSYLDMRLEKKQTEQTHLIWQRNSVEKCQDIALEVEYLKSEITNFLNNSSNNDSGVWEREEGTAHELRAIAHLLRRLRGIIDTDCTCGLEEENKKLKQLNESMKLEVTELQRRIGETKESKENVDQQYQLQIVQKEQELQQIRQQMFSIEENSRERHDTCDTLALQVQQLEVLLSDKTTELYNVQQQCESQEILIKQLREDVQKSENNDKEKKLLEAQVSQLSEEVRVWRDRCGRVAARYREERSQARALRADVCAAHRRGAALCAHAQTAARAVRRWLRAQKHTHTQQEEIIKQQEILIRALRTRNSNTESVSDEPCCSRYLHRARQNDTNHVRVSETASTSYLIEPRRHYSCPRASEAANNCYIEEARRQCSSTRASEIPIKGARQRYTSTRASETEHSRAEYMEESFSRDLDYMDRCAREMTCGNCVKTSETDSPPTPPVRLLRKKNLTAEKKREISSPSELLERVERAHEALCDARRRWNCV